MLKDVTRVREFLLLLLGDTGGQVEVLWGREQGSFVLYGQSTCLGCGSLSGDHLRSNCGGCDGGDLPGDLCNMEELFG